MTSKSSSHDAVKAFLKSAERIAESLQSMGEEDRMRVLLKLYETTSKVESAWDTFLRLFLIEPTTTASLKVLQDLHIFDKWYKNGGNPMTANQLAQLTDGKCEPELLARLLRTLAAVHLVEMRHDGKFTPTKICRQLADPDWRAAAQFHHDYTMRMMTHMPKFFAEEGYQNPHNNRKTVFDSAFNWDGGLFKYFEKYPDQSEMFNNVQKTSTASQPRWTAIFPCHTLLKSDPQLPLLVDVGGNVGQDIQPFLSKYPETASRLYLEDLPSVIETVKPSAGLGGINKVAYNFFKPQPITHARAYYMHHILHDWPDRQARKILEMQKLAMKPGHSSILIHDQVMDDDSPPHPHAAGFDITMLAFGASQERTEREWRALVTSVGLEVVKIWRLPFVSQGVIEAKLVEDRPRL